MYYRVIFIPSAAGSGSAVARVEPELIITDFIVFTLTATARPAGAVLYRSREWVFKEDYIRTNFLFDAD